MCFTPLTLISVPLLAAGVPTMSGVALATVVGAAPVGVAAGAVVAVEPEQALTASTATDARAAI
jgi:hypothetical protein